MPDGWRIPRASKLKSSQAFDSCRTPPDNPTGFISAGSIDGLDGLALVVSPDLSCVGVIHRYLWPWVSDA